MTRNYRRCPQCSIDNSLFRGRPNEVNMNTSHLLWIKLRNAVTVLQRIALAGPPLPIILRYLALNGKTGPIRLKAALRLRNDDLLIRLAHEAAEEGIRLQAALLTREESALTAFALNAWDIDMGKTAVAQITNKFLLVRIALAARQDPIRLAAAIKLRSPRLLQQLAQSTADIQVRWQIAQLLDDPNLLAQVALFKTTNEHLAPLRRKARRTFLNHLNSLQDRDNQTALAAIFFTQSNVSIKLEVFLRLGNDTIRTALLRHLAHCNFEHAVPDLTQQMLTKIQSAGWYLKGSVQFVSCPQCLGKGMLSDRTIIVHQRRYDSEFLPCSECSGVGHIQLNMVTCTRRGEDSIVFKLPLPNHSHS